MKVTSLKTVHTALVNLSKMVQYGGSIPPGEAELFACMLAEEAAKQYHSNANNLFDDAKNRYMKRYRDQGLFFPTIVPNRKGFYRCHYCDTQGPSKAAILKVKCSQGEHLLERIRGISVDDDCYILVDKKQKTWQFETETDCNVFWDAYGDEDEEGEFLYTLNGVNGNAAAGEGKRLLLAAIQKEDAKAKRVTKYDNGNVQGKYV